MSGCVVQIAMAEEFSISPNLTGIALVRVVINQAKSCRAVFPGRKAQGVFVPPIFGKLGNGFDEILLMGLAEREAVEPPLATELVKANHLP